MRLRLSACLFLSCMLLLGQVVNPYPKPLTPLIANSPATPIFGEQTIVGNAVAVTITNQNTYYPITAGWAAGDSAGITQNPASGSFTTVTGGEYLTLASLTTTVTSANHLYKFGIFRNGVLLTAHTASRSSNGNTLFTVTPTGLAALSIGDVVDLRVECTDAAGQSVTVTEANFNLKL